MDLIPLRAPTAPASIAAGQSNATRALSLPLGTRRHRKSARAKRSGVDAGDCPRDWLTPVIMIVMGYRLTPPMMTMVAASAIAHFGLALAWYDQMAHGAGGTT